MALGFMQQLDRLSNLDKKTLICIMESIFSYKVEFQFSQGFKQQSYGGL